jgi:hypothetical protein
VERIVLIISVTGLRRAIIGKDDDDDDDEDDYDDDDIFGGLHDLISDVSDHIVHGFVKLSYTHQQMSEC